MREWIKATQAPILLGNDPEAAVRDVDCVVTDTWFSMGDKDGEYRHNLLKPYQVNARLMSLAKPDALFMHCLPAHRGDEVTDEVIDGPQSVVFDEAENRLHVQKGILAWCLAATLALVVVGCIAICIYYVPNNWDSCTYRFSRPFFYLARGNLLHFPTGDSRTIFYPLNGALFYLFFVLYQYPARAMYVVTWLAWIFAGIGVVLEISSVAVPSHSGSKGVTLTMMPQRA